MTEAQKTGGSWVISEEKVGEENIEEICPAEGYRFYPDRFGRH